MSWNYRVVRETDVEDIIHYIAEYYDGVYSRPRSVEHYDAWGGDPIESLRETLQSMLLALDKHIIVIWDEKTPETTLADINFFMNVFNYYCRCPDTILMHPKAYRFLMHSSMTKRQYRRWRGKQRELR